ncbi:hypothetical protein Rhopal_000727-T1 [Rhodotorula paludigena]|uniref:TRAF-type domain-containing protein n=1 Tax=Rhodotorula paludigena TaxID=86838 RepID=A0AAV5GFD2_9BASI|nr:hypothetical protein Rhopal_000727-T1 [Rhodotorula paludigena]
MPYPAAQFIGDLPSAFRCCKCDGAAYPPISLCSSGHLACSTDAIWLVNSDEAPQPPVCVKCDEAISRDTLCCEPTLKTEMETLRYECRAETCKWIGKLGELSKHECPEVQEGSRRLIETISKKKAQWMVCPQCACKLKRVNEDKHMQKCPDGIIVCPRGGPDCGSQDGGKYQRKDTTQHKAACTSFTCAATPGCTYRGTSISVEEHTKTCCTTSSLVHLLASPFSSPASPSPAPPARTEASAPAAGNPLLSLSPILFSSSPEPAVKLNESTTPPHEEPLAPPAKSPSPSSTPQAPPAPLQSVQLLQKCHETGGEEDAFVQSAKRPLGDFLASFLPKPAKKSRTAE